MPWLEVLLVFVFSFATEALSCLFIVAISRNNYLVAFLFSAAATSLSHGAWWLVLGDRDYILASWLGELLGTAFVVYHEARHNPHFRKWLRQHRVRFVSYLNAMAGRRSRVVKRRRARPRRKGKE